MKRSGLWKSPLPFLAGLIVIYLAIPVVAFLVRLASSHNEGFNQAGLFPSLVISLESATISLALVTLFGIPLAYLLARSKGRLSELVGLVVQLPLALPPLMAGFLLIYLVGPYTFFGRLFDQHLTMSLAGIVLSQTFVAAPFLVVSARAAFSSIDRGMLDVGATLGHSEVSRFWRIALPIAGPGIRAGMLLTWLRAFGEYGSTVVLSYHPFSLPVYTYNQFDSTGLPTTIAPTALALVVAIVVVGLSRVRLPPRPKAVGVPTSVDIEVLQPTPVTFDIDYRVGTFRLCLTQSTPTRHLGILGPSGAGKSMLLRSIVGLYGRDPGAVFYGDRNVSAALPQDRGVGYMSQGFGLFPHMTVWENLLFARGSTPEVAAHWLESLKLTGLQDRYPSQISGGQRQRVGLAQALCRSSRLLVLDEPFSALDVPVRRELRQELRRLQRQTGLASVVVTHDPEEAAMLADEIIVVSDGRCLQGGSARELFSHPSSAEVANLIGIRNFQSGVVAGQGIIDTQGVRLEVDTENLLSGTAVNWTIRPEDISLAGSGYRAVVTDLADLGPVIELSLEVESHLSLVVRTTVPMVPQVGETCHVGLLPESISLWASPQNAVSEVTYDAPRNV